MKYYEVGFYYFGENDEKTDFTKNESKNACHFISRYPNL